MKDPFLDLPEPAPLTIRDIIVDNAPDLYCKDQGLLTPCPSVTRQVINVLLDDRDKADYLDEAVRYYMDSGEFVDLVKMARVALAGTKEAQALEDGLHGMAAAFLKKREEDIREEYFSQEATMKEYYLESMAVDNYEDKKGI